MNGVSGLTTANSAKDAVYSSENQKQVIEQVKAKGPATNQQTKDLAEEAIKEKAASDVKLSTATRDTALRQLKEQLKNTSLEISYNDDVNRFSVAVLDNNTKEVIKEIPSKEMIEILQRTKELIGMMIDERR